MRPILVVGGGIGGLTLAIALKQAAVPVEIWERVPEYTPVGAGIVLAINAMAVLRRLGLGEAAEQRGHVLTRFFITDDRGRGLGRLDLTETARVYGASIGIHRADLHDVLISAAANIPFRSGLSVRSIEQHDDVVNVESTLGDRDDYSLVVGADGIRSRVRELVFGPIEPSYAGYTCWRLVLPNVDRIADATEMWGQGKRVGLVPIAGDRIYVFATINTDGRQNDPPEGRVDRFRRRFAEFGGPVQRLFAHVTHPDQLLHNDIDEVWMDRWYDRRAVLLGDAAHAMTPNTGQGAGMALEDAYVLAREIARATTTGADVGPYETPGFSSALANYQTTRQTRVRHIHRASQQLGRVGQWSSPLACTIRNLLMRATPDRVSRKSARAIVDAGVKMIEDATPRTASGGGRDASRGGG